MRGIFWRRGAWAAALVVPLLLASSRVASAQSTGAGAPVDRLVLDNGVRVVLLRTGRAGPVAVAIAVRDALVSPPSSSAGDDPGTPLLSDSAPWGDLPAAERGALFTARSVHSTVGLSGLATVRTLVAPGDELPLLLHLAGHGLREARWDEQTLARATAHPTAFTTPRAFAIARQRLFPRALAAAEGNPSALDRLRGLERARTQRETVVTVVGDLDADRAAELVHHYLDGAPRRPASSAAAPSHPTALPPGAGAAPSPLASPAFAVTFALRLDGEPARRHALRLAFEILSRGRLRGLRDSTGTLMVNELDEPTIGGRLLALRFVTSDATTLRGANVALSAAVTKLVAEGPTQAELTAAAARLAIGAELATLSPAVHASESALSELAGERFTAGVAPSPAAVQAVLADGFAEGRRLTLVEQPSP